MTAAFESWASAPNPNGNTNNYFACNIFMLEKAPNKQTNTVFKV